MSAGREATFIVRLNRGDDDESLFAKAAWKDGDLALTVLDADKAWLCTITADDLNDLKTEKKVDKVNDWADEAFRSAGASAKDHLFSIKSKAKNLSWKRVRPGTKLKVSLGEFPLTRLDFADANAEVLGGALDNMLAMEEKLRKGDQERAELKKQLDEMSKLAESFEVEKNRTEKRLYEQFLPILQEKQRKNAELAEQLKKGRSVAAADSDASGDGYDDNTDEDEPDAKKGKAATEEGLNDSQESVDILMC